MTDKNEKELTTWGFVTDRMRSGLITAILGLLVVSVCTLFTIVLRSKDEVTRTQKELYERMIQERVDKKMEQPVKAINDVVSKVDTAAHKATAAANKVDSLSDQYIKTQQK